MSFTNKHAKALYISSLLLVILVTYLIYSPGLSGPFIFDDIGNITQNRYIKIQDLSFDSIYNAANSTDSGQLRRPIALVSFALNYYFAGTLDSAAPFKLTNLIIHIINGMLMAWLSFLVFTRIKESGIQNSIFSNFGHSEILLLSLVPAFLWVIHPISLTSVLYVVQRMTSLASLFMILGMISYLIGRLRIIEKRKSGVFLLIFGVLMFGALGVFSKEITLLLPLYIAALEYLLFSAEYPWNRWQALSKNNRNLLISGMCILLISGLVFSLLYARAGYEIREFTMLERAFTEPRILIFYLSLILLPRINEFGIYHDYLQISESLLSPWTTLPSILVVIFLIAIAFFTRKKHPLLSLGLFWFFIAHTLESTIFSLELIHEHRNYLASYGIMLIVTYLALYLYWRTKDKKAWLIIPILAVLFAGMTAVRSEQWSSKYSLLFYETKHHPDSARAWSDFSEPLQALGRDFDAIDALLQAIELNPTEPGNYLNLYILTFLTNISFPEKYDALMLAAIKEQPKSRLFNNVIFNIDRCIQTTCTELQKPAELWIRTAIEDTNITNFEYYLGRNLVGQGRFDEAVTYLLISHERKPNKLLPLIDLTDAYIMNKNIEKAVEFFEKAKEKNNNDRFPRDEDIKYIESKLEILKK